MVGKRSNGKEEQCVHTSEGKHPGIQDSGMDCPWPADQSLTAGLGKESKVQKQEKRHALR